jgi:hypothetical protein
MATPYVYGSSPALWGIVENSNFFVLPLLFRWYCVPVRSFLRLLLLDTQCLSLDSFSSSLPLRLRWLRHPYRLDR